MAEHDTNARPAKPMERPFLRPWIAWSIIVGLGLAIWLADVWFQVRPESIPVWGWRLLAIFLPTVLALMIRPIPGGAAVLLALVMATLCGALPAVSEDGKPVAPMEVALAGYRDPTVWLVLAAFFISRALIKTGLARRIALNFVRLLGHNTLGLSYAVVASDTVLAGMIPSNAARVGGVILPITRSLAELYKSYPGSSAGLLGTFLMLTLYQGDVMACALFITGQASNWLAAREALALTTSDVTLPGGPIEVSYGTWFLYALAPAAVCLLGIPWLIHRLERPEITHTPLAAAFAREELQKMGSPRLAEWVVILVFLGVCGFWIVDTGATNTALIALGGVGVLLLSGVLTWEDCVTERGAWDVFIWYGGLVQLGKLLGRAEVFKVFASFVASHLTSWPLVLALVFLLLVYFYTHYAFASITTHILAMYRGFVVVLILAGAPPLLAVYAFAYFTNFSAGLTHYGTTPAPIVFGTGYVTQRTWWRVGLLISIFNIAVWLTVGVLWWRLLGLW